MLTKKELNEVIARAQKAVNKARENALAAQSNADPAINAELQHSLQLALKQLGTVIYRIEEVNSCLRVIEDTVSLRFPADEEKKAAVLA